MLFSAFLPVLLSPVLALVSVFRRERIPAEGGEIADEDYGDCLLHSGFVDGESYRTEWSAARSYWWYGAARLCHGEDVTT